MLQETPFEVAFSKQGDTVHGTRSNEFGYANYEILSKPPGFLNPLAKGESAQAHEVVPPGPRGKCAPREESITDRRSLRAGLSAPP